MKTVTVTTGFDPSPLALIFAKKVRQALDDSAYLSHAANCEGMFGIQSKHDPQAITLNVTQSSVNATSIDVTAGINPGCKIVIVLDLNNASAKPKIRGLLKHPRFAMNVGKLLSFPEVSWADALKKFWDQHQDVAGMPHGMTIKCLDEDRQLSVGNSDEPCYFEGNAQHLSNAFTGDSPFVQLLASGKIHGRYTFQQATVLSNITLNMMLGDA